MTAGQVTTESPWSARTVGCAPVPPACASASTSLKGPTAATCPVWPVEEEDEEDEEEDEEDEDEDEDEEDEEEDEDEVLVALRGGRLI